uniref:uncharacterized protein LOC122594210 n=1 Tax=Erigeron canadensis TaxID=72917 RepID=UPI001CB964F8|nr:uncharacterized protein LOC122594210 [Erigeron canadensis]XP_043622616.1 uncharacterized protein LOC122594210 [Erigeron canadensis]
MTSSKRFQAVPLVASPTYPNAMAWSHENLLAIASGHLVTILNPAMPFGPKGLITIPAAAPFQLGLIQSNKDLVSGCLLPTCLSRDPRPSVRSISWSSLGLAPNGGCLLAVCTTQGVVKVYRSPFLEYSADWVEVVDISEMIHSYFSKSGYGEVDVPSSEDCRASQLDVEQGNNEDPSLSNLGSRKHRRLNPQDNRNLSFISAEQYASRSALVSSLIVAWSPMLHSNLSSSCSVLAIGAKSGKIMLWRVHVPQCYSITEQSKVPVVSLSGFIQAHSSWITAISWSTFVSDGSTQLLLCTGCADGSVKVWRGYMNDLVESTKDDMGSFSLLKEVINVGSGPVSVLSLLVPDISPHKITLAVGKGSGSLEILTYDTSIDKFNVFGHYAHDHIVTGLAWAYDGKCLYSCSQDNSLHSWIIKDDLLHEVPIPSNILGVKISTDVPNVFDACFGIAVSPANLVLAVVRSFDINLLNPMYEARSLKGAVEFFWIGGQKLKEDPESNKESLPGFPNMDLVNWGNNILWSLNQCERFYKPIVVWDVITALSVLKKSNVNYVEKVLATWLLSYAEFEWGRTLETVLPHVFECLPSLTSRQLHLLNLVNRHVILGDKITSEEGSESGESNLWIKLLEMSERELRERLIGCSFAATLNGCNGNLQPVKLTQMKWWVSKNGRVVKDFLRLLASEVTKIEKRYVAEEECIYCSAPVPFESTEVAFCNKGNDERHKLARCAVSMSVCPLSPLWFCVSCNRRVSNFAPESLFTLLRYPPAGDSVERIRKRLHRETNDKVLLKPLCPFCGVLLQRLQPEFLLSTNPV